MEVKPRLYISSCSFGKDSIATILLALENKEPLDRVVFAEVMFDHKRGISGEIPEHIDWIYSTAIPKIESMGVKVDVIRSEKDYMYFFTKTVGEGKYKGKLYGFPLAGRCVINRECKVGAIRRYYKHFDADIVSYIGIAIDEPKRLTRLNGEKKISLLAKYGYTEQMAMDKCKEYGLVSPLYVNSHRGGCWFCPNTKLSFFIEFRKKHQYLWTELRELSYTPNLCTYGFKYGKTFQEVEKKMDSIEWIEQHQLKLF